MFMKFRWNLIVVFIPFVIIVALILLKIIDYHTYHKLCDEDGLIEYLTAALFLGAAYISLKVVMLINKAYTKVKLAFSILCILFLFIALEEISWGQRIICLETPDSIKSINVQDELNVHNMAFFHSITMDVYILIGLIGVFGWWLNKKFKIIDPQLSPRKGLRFYFLPILMSAFYFEYGIDLLENFSKISTQNYLYFIERIDNEPCEMVMSMGFLLSVFFCL